jgi:hypothetical protein
MCTPALAIAGVSAIASVGGTIMSANAQKSVAEAQMNAAAQAQQAQEQGFFTRMQAQSDQNARDFATQQSAMQSQQAGFQAMEDQQSQARAQREAQIAATNQQTQDVGAKAQALIAQTEGQVTPGSLQAAQTQQQQQIENLASPGANNIASGTAQTPSGPTAAPVQTNNETASAIATRMAQAAAATRQYAGRQAQVASETTAVPAALQIAGTNLGTAAEPLASQQKQIEAGQPAYLAPSTVAYNQASNYYQNLLNAINQRTQGRLNVSQTIATGDITGADLQQADTATAAQNQAALAAWQAASNPIPGILSGVGSLGLYAAGRVGAGNSVVAPIFGTASNPSSFTTWMNTPFSSMIS